MPKRKQAPAPMGDLVRHAASVQQRVDKACGGADETVEDEDTKAAGGLRIPGINA